MPMNEAVLYKRGGLTKQQKFDQQAYVYGLNPKDYQNMTPATPFTQDQLAQMRQILAQHDSAGKDGPKEFDLSKPPVPQYRHQEYPRCMYHHATGRTKNANSPEEREAAEEQGWSTSPTPVTPFDEPDPSAGLSDEDRAEAAALDAKLAEANSKKKSK